MRMTVALIGLCAATTTAGELPERRQLVIADPSEIAAADGRVKARIYLDADSVGVTEASLTRLDMAPDTVIDPRVHPQATEVIYVLSGEVDLVRPKTRSHLSAGKAALVPAGAVHGFAVGKEGVELLQFFVPGGPEQRLRDGTDPGTVSPDPTPPRGWRDDADIELLDGSTAPTRHVGKKTYCYLAEERPAGEQSCDLMKVDRPSGQAADVHPHDDVSELIYIVRGEGEVTIDGHTFEVRAGSAYYTPLGSEMGLATTAETESVVLVVNR